jgi:surface protein
MANTRQRVGRRRTKNCMHLETMNSLDCCRYHQSNQQRQGQKTEIGNNSRPFPDQATGNREMDCVTMVLVERETGLPLDLVVLINSFLYERLTDENFKQAIALWFQNKEECKFRFGHISDWNTSRVTNMARAFYYRRDFNEDIGRWNVGRVTNMWGMFFGAFQFNQDIGQWDVSNVTNMGLMFSGAVSYEGVRWV